MVVNERETERKKTQTRRGRPESPLRCDLPYSCEGVRSSTETPGPIELVIWATDGDGEAADWLTDGWWMESFRLWKDRAVVVRLQATHQSLLHPVLLHQWNMLRRIVPHWRITADGWLEEVVLDSDAELLAMSPFDSVRLLPRDRAYTSLAEAAWKFEQVNSKVRQVQARHRLTRPVLSFEDSTVLNPVGQEHLMTAT